MSKSCLAEIFYRMFNGLINWSYYLTTIHFLFRMVFSDDISDDDVLIKLKRKNIDISKEDLLNIMSILNNF